MGTGYRLPHDESLSNGSIASHGTGLPNLGGAHQICQYPLAILLFSRDPRLGFADVFCALPILRFSPSDPLCLPQSCLGDLDHDCGFRIPIWAVSRLYQRVIYGAGRQKLPLAATYPRPATHFVYCGSDLLFGAPNHRINTRLPLAEAYGEDRKQRNSRKARNPDSRMLHKRGRGYVKRGKQENPAR